MEFRYGNGKIMQTLCTFFQTDNHAGTSSHNFKGEMLFLALNRFKALKAKLDLDFQNFLIQNNTLTTHRGKKKVTNKTN